MAKLRAAKKSDGGKGMMLRWPGLAVHFADFVPIV
jgi:hypothetical protein